MLHFFPSGVDVTHPLFGGRVDKGLDCATDLEAGCKPAQPPLDPDGHGTHVAGKYSLYAVIFRNLVI